MAFVTTVHSHSDKPGEPHQVLVVRDKHHLEADTGDTDDGPDGHDIFDASLAACKSLTAMWYAKKHGIPLERVDTHLERDASEERKGVYKLRVRATFEGPLTDEQRAQLHRAIAACPVHKLMTTIDVQIENVVE